MKQEEVNRCQIQEWYPNFKSVSIKTQIHELPESFIHYLLDDSGPFLLPVSIYNDDALPNRIHNPEEEEDYQVSEGSGDESEQPSRQQSFPELELKVKESTESLGGAVFPKLNWSAPKDSAWISTTGSLRCTSFSEIALLLRSSESLTHDLCHAYDSCSDKSSSRPQSFFLALRKWYPSLRPEMEFRCFVWGQKLVGISQREVTTFYPILLEKKTYLERLIQQFYEDNVRLKFESNNYTFDVYVTTDERVKILDFNPWGAFTLPLLFDWEELEQNTGEEGSVDFRIVESRCGVRPGLKTAVPYDYLDTSPGSGWDQFLRNADEESQGSFRLCTVLLDFGEGLTVPSASTRRFGMLEHLPKDVTVDILSRLPVKTLIGLRCVSKTWYSVISSPHFVATHLSRALSDPQYPPYLILRHYDDKLQKERFTLHSSDDPFPRKHIYEQVNYSFAALNELYYHVDEVERKGGFFEHASDFVEFSCPEKSAGRFFSVVGSCNGLLCLADDVSGYRSDAYVLWNPSIRKAVRLPSPEIRFASHGPHRHSLGFGYDPAADDYKLVRIVYLGGATRFGFNRVPPQVEIYTLRTGAWRPIAAQGPPYAIGERSFSAFVNGAIHWLGRTPFFQNAFRSVIVTFNVGDEAFGELAVPESLQGYLLNMTVMVLNGSLALVPCNQWLGDKCHSVWVMMEYGVTESWTKMFDIEIEGGLVRVIGFTENGKVLLATKAGKLLSYEPSSGGTMDLHIRGLTQSLYLDTYVESLVLLNAADRVQGHQGNRSGAN